MGGWLQVSRTGIWFKGLSDSIVLVLKLDDRFLLFVEVTRLCLSLARYLAGLRCVSMLSYKLSIISLLMGLNMFLNLIFLVSNVISLKADFQCSGFAIIVESQLLCI